MVKYVCDFCGKQFNSKNSLKRFSIGIGDVVTTGDDICFDCRRELDRQIHEMKLSRHRENEQKEEPESREDCHCAGSICGDNRYDVINAAKHDLFFSTNIQQSPDELKCIDSFLFRCWQMGWLWEYDDTKPKYEEMYGALRKVKEEYEKYLRGVQFANPEAQAIYTRVCDALREDEKKA